MAQDGSGLRRRRRVRHRADRHGLRQYLSLGRRRNCNPAVVPVAILPRALGLEQFVGEL
jgi:hypothetical protein